MISPGAAFIKNKIRIFVSPRNRSFYKCYNQRCMRANKNIANRIQRHHNFEFPQEKEKKEQLNVHTTALSVHYHYTIQSVRKITSIERQLVQR